MKRWEMDGLTVTLNEGHFDVEGIERLPPGWYRIHLDHDRDGPRLSVRDLGVEEARDTHTLISIPYRDLIHRSYIRLPTP